jgi:hypothetical protein
VTQNSFGEEEVPGRRTDLRPSGEELLERRSDVFRHKNTPEYKYYQCKWTVGEIIAFLSSKRRQTGDLTSLLSFLTVG